MSRIAINKSLPDYLTIETDNKTIVEKITSSKFQLKDINLAFEVGEKHLDISLKSESTKIKFIKIRWSLKLNKKSKILCDEWERSYGYMGFKPIQPNRIMPWYFLSEYNNCTIGIGVKVRPNAFCFWQVDPSGVTLILDVRNGGNGLALGGRELSLAKIVSHQYSDIDSFAAAKSFCQLMCEDPLLPEYPIFGSNNWYYAYGDSSEDDIIQDSKYLNLMTQHCKNNPFMIIDDGWQQNHRILEYNGGPWDKGNNKFPNLKSLCKTIKDMGIHPGIWIRPLLNESPLFNEDCRLINNALDPTHPLVKQQIRKDISNLCNIGFELIKHDFSTFDLFDRWGFEMNPLITRDGWNFYDSTLTNAEIVKDFYQIILEECNKTNTLILGCNTVGHLGAGLMHLHRVGDDTSGVSWERTRQIGINSLAFRLPQHNTFYHIDADCVGITGEIDWKYNKQWTEVIARSGTPLFVSVKPGILTETELFEMQELMLIASTQLQKMTPKDWEDCDCPEIWGEKKEVIEYNWYQENGLDFITNPIRYQSFLSIE